MNRRSYHLRIRLRLIIGLPSRKSRLAEILLRADFTLRVLQWLIDVGPFVPAGVTP